MAGNPAEFFSPTLSEGAGGAANAAEVFMFAAAAAPTPLPPPTPLPVVQQNPLAGNLLASPVDFGSDVDAFSDLNPLLPLINGYALLGQALCHRLQTPRGSLFYAPDYGTDTRAYLNSTMTSQRLTQIRADIQGECLKDERVQSCTANVTFIQQLGQLQIQINVTTSSGPFIYLLAVTALTVQLLDRVQVS